MIELGLIVAAGTLAVGIGLSVALRLLPTVRLQLAGLALLAVVLPLAAVILSGAVMFHMHDDVAILAVSAASASSALAAAFLLGAGIARPTWFLVVGNSCRRHGVPAYRNNETIRP